MDVVLLAPDLQQAFGATKQKLTDAFRVLFLDCSG